MTANKFLMTKLFTFIKIFSIKLLISFGKSYYQDFLLTHSSLQTKSADGKSTPFLVGKYKQVHQLSN
jgi:hypothetical protein